ncbi:MAG: hypothetical protein ACOVOQ_01190, partial [Flavobacterium sp.]
IICFLLTSCFTEPKKENTVEEEIQVYEEKPEEKIDSVINNSTESAETSTKNSLVLFDNVNGIYPGKSSFNDAKYILGTPDYIDLVGEKNLDGTYSYTNKIVVYKRIGITLVFPSLNVNVGTIDAINVTDGFDGISKEGIYIGIKKDECLKILNEKFYLIRELDDNYFFAKDESIGSESQFIFKNDKLETIRTD